MTLQTKDSLINVDGTISLVKEAIDLSLKTDSRHFSVRSVGSTSTGQSTVTAPWST
jgi:hypothetical protein